MSARLRPSTEAILDAAAPAGPGRTIQPASTAAGQPRLLAGAGRPATVASDPATGRPAASGKAAATKTAATKTRTKASAAGKSTAARSAAAKVVTAEAAAAKTTAAKTATTKTATTKTAATKTASGRTGSAKAAAATAPRARTGRAPAAVLGTRKPGVRELSAQATRDSLLRAAIKVFARHGFDGGSIEQISSTARSHDRMIYYYFGSKQGLYTAVLEETYRRFDEAEAALDLDLSQPVEALVAVVRFMLSYYRRNPEFVTLLNTENLHRGQHIARSRRKGEYASPALSIIETLLKSGAATRTFRTDLSARDLYLMIASLGYFYQSNRFTLSAFFGENLEAPDAIARWEAFCIDAVLRKVAPLPATALPSLSDPAVAAQADPAAGAPVEAPGPENDIPIPREGDESWQKPPRPQRRAR